MNKNDISLENLVKLHSTPPVSSNKEELYVAAASTISTFSNSHKLTQDKDYTPYIVALLAATMVASLVAILS